MGCHLWGSTESDTSEVSQKEKDKYHILTHTYKVEKNDTEEPIYRAASEKAVAIHSSVLAWRIPGMGEPGGLLSMGSHRVRHNRSDLSAAAARERIGYPLQYT